MVAKKEMTPKEYLEQVKIINRSVVLLEEKRMAMRASLYGRSVDYSTEKMKKSTKENETENAITQVIDYENAVKKEISNLVKSRLQVEKSINELIPDPVVREIFERKYLLFQTWPEISDKVNYSLQHLHRLHTANLPKFTVKCGETPVASAVTVNPHRRNG